MEHEKLAQLPRRRLRPRRPGGLQRRPRRLQRQLPRRGAEAPPTGCREGRGRCRGRCTWQMANEQESDAGATRAVLFGPDAYKEGAQGQCLVSVCITHMAFNIDFLGGTKARCSWRSPRACWLASVGSACSRGRKEPLSWLSCPSWALQAFRMVWDDFSFAANLCAAPPLSHSSMPLVSQHPIINACAVVNFVMWWFMALLTSHCLPGQHDRWLPLWWHLLVGRAS